MKNILFLLAVLFTAASCTTVNYSEKRWSIDFREYIKDPNFTINPTDISNKDFEPIGLIKLEFYVGTNVKRNIKTMCVRREVNGLQYIMLQLWKE